MGHRMVKYRQENELLELVAVTVTVPSTDTNYFHTMAAAARVEEFDRVLEMGDMDKIAVLAGKRIPYRVGTPEPDRTSWDARAVNDYNILRNKFVSADEALLDLTEYPPLGENTIVKKAERFVLSNKLMSMIAMKEFET